MKDLIKTAWKEGENADSFSDLVRHSPVANITQHAFVFLFLAIVIGVALLVLGEFFEALPTDEHGNYQHFNESMGAVEDNTGTGLIVFGIVLIVIPVVAILAYLWANLGGVAGAAGGNGRMRR